MKKSVISRKLGVNRRTVYNWSLRPEKSEDWRDRKQPGSKSRLTKDQKEKLKKIIDSGQRTYGYDTDPWTLKRISEVISKEFNVNYNTHLAGTEESWLFSADSCCGGNREE